MTSDRKSWDQFLQKKLIVSAEGTQPSDCARLLLATILLSNNGFLYMLQQCGLPMATFSDISSPLFKPSGTHLNSVCLFCQLKVKTLIYLTSFFTHCVQYLKQWQRLLKQSPLPFHLCQQLLWQSAGSHLQHIKPQNTHHCTNGNQLASNLAIMNTGDLG